MVRWLPQASAACVLALLGVGATACGGSSNATLPSVATAGAGASSAPSGATPTADSPSVSPVLQPPASQYSINLNDLGTAFITDIPATYVLTVDNYAATKTFTSVAEGKKDLTKWGYLGGYETGYSPEGRQTAVLQGQYYISVESHLFKTVDGATQAFAYFQDRLKGQSQPISGPPVGNESSIWKLVEGTVPTSTVPAVYHRLIFRRGNLVTIVLTYGADKFMTVNIVHDLAVIVDEKALGHKKAIAPTPTSNFTPNISGATVTNRTPVPKQ